MINTGARNSTIRVLPPDTSLTNKSISHVGFKGKETARQLTTPVTVKSFSQTLLHSFVFAANCSVNLLGRDLVIAMCPLSSNAALMNLSWNFRMVTPIAALPSLPAMTPPSSRLLSNALWHAPLLTFTGLKWTLTPAVGSNWSALGLFWLPWVRNLRSYDMVSDCMHCALYYDRSGNEIYGEAFQENENSTWELNIGDLFVGKPGVAFSVSLTPEQLKWYMIANPPDPSTPPCHPCVSLMVSPWHTAKDLGPFVLACTQATDWQN